MSNSPKTTLTDADKARLYNMISNHDERLKAQPYQLFLVDNEGRWNEILAERCVPDLLELEDHTLFAIIDRVPYQVVIHKRGSEFIPFSSGDDGQTQNNFLLIANGVEVGESSFCEY